eukprot:TRINITY_DN16244_c0_g2_i1.p1 TRINITY_DN16244_c0_g2~~TRINITY_DN16244_c0_g2_i1.p1  ORF type:complete len:448 (+),score=72.93 TRINITY_DN16244_c0_g2_i1:90-1346(+)
MVRTGWVHDAASPRSPETQRAQSASPSSAGDRPPHRAVYAAEVRGDVVCYDDTLTFALCKNGRIERYCNGHWTGAVVRMEWRDRGIYGTAVATEGSVRREREVPMLSRNAPENDFRMLVALAENAEVPIQGPSSQESAPRVQTTPQSSRGKVLRRALGFVQRIAPQVASPRPQLPAPATPQEQHQQQPPEPVTEPPGPVLRQAEDRGATFVVTMQTRWLRCRRQRLERFVGTDWWQGVGVMDWSDLEGHRVQLRDGDRRPVADLILPEREDGESLYRLAIAAGVVHHPREPADSASADPDPDDMAERAPSSALELRNNVRMRNMFGSKRSFWSLASAKPQPLSDLDSCPGELPGTVNSHPTAELPEGMQCVVCMDNPRSTVLFPCRHLCCCAECALALDKCPICRRTAEHRVEVWLSA